MKKSFSKIIAIALIIALNYAGLLSVGKTMAVFSDTETSEGNTFTSGALDISASPDSFSQEIIDRIVEIPITIDHSQTTVPGQYKMTITESGASEHNLCSALTADLRDGHDVSLYSGALIELNSATTTMSIASGESYTLRVSTSSALAKELNGKTCKFEIHVVAWQEGVENPTDGGFADSEIIFGAITSWAFGGGVALNEFLPNPTGSDSADMPNGEWVELYNNSSEAKDVSGWYVRDSSDGTGHQIFIDSEHAVAQTIGAKSWLVVYMNKEFLNNKTDTVRLFDDNDNPVDSYSYCGPLTSGGNCGSIPENKSFARIPDGTGEWVDPIPTPGGVNEIGNEISVERSAVFEEENGGGEDSDIAMETVVEEENTVTQEVTPTPITDEEPFVPEITEIADPAIVEETITETVETVIIIASEPEPKGSLEVTGEVIS
jgi:predicted ribosomally synthesized peptide with SipW-like signal peptide